MKLDKVGLPFKSRNLIILLRLVAQFRTTVANLVVNYVKKELIDSGNHTIDNFVHISDCLMDKVPKLSYLGAILAGR